MKLVVIEGPGKKETLKKYLGSDYDVFATKGHIRDLPSNEFAIDINKNFEPKYVPMPDKVEIIRELKKKAKDSSEVLLATDPDREGEAISWHIATLLDIDKSSKCRIEFNEISKDVVNKAVKLPREIDEKLVDAQQARRVLDRLVGYKISPIICKKIKPRLSAGRVQSVTLELVVDREEEINSFVPEEYWNINANLLSKTNFGTIKASLEKENNKKIKIESKAKADAILEILKNAEYKVAKVSRGPLKSSPSAPFTTSTMQQEAQNKIGFDLTKTTKTAQVLYEGVNVEGEGKVALITYIRTDSTRVSEEAQKKAKDFIIGNFGTRYYPPKTRVYQAKANAQDAHEAIRPIHIEKTPSSLNGKIPPDALKLYKLIYDRFIASQMADAIYDNLHADIIADRFMLKATGKVLTFPGFLSVYKNIEDSDENSNDKIPNLEPDEVLALKDLKSEQKFTKPPQRYTEASLVKTMEEKGIGRPATYAPTITTLFSREYTTKDGKSIIPTELGKQVTKFMKDNFKSIMDVKFTAQMEESLDKVAEGERQWKDVIAKFWRHFEPFLSSADKMHYESSKVPAEETDMVCEKCGGKMVIRDGKYGKFIGCSNYPKCKNIKNIVSNETKSYGQCPKCGGEVIEKRTKMGKVFYGCSNYPKCDYASWNDPTKINKEEK